MRAATRSIPECMASERTATEPIKQPDRDLEHDEQRVREHRQERCAALLARTKPRSPPPYHARKAPQEHETSRRPTNAPLLAKPGYTPDDRPCAVGRGCLIEAKYRTHAAGEQARNSATRVHALRVSLVDMK